MPKRTHDIIGGPSLAVWLAMVAVATVAWAAIPDWHIPDGTRLPRGTPADALIERALSFAVVWVAGIVSLPILVFMPQLLSTSFLAEVAAACLVVRFGRQLRISTPRVESGGARDQNFGKRHTLTACFPPEAELWTGAWPHLARMSRACENRPHG